MHRQRVIVAAVILAILGGALPMAAMYYVSWKRAVNQEQKRLTLAAQRVIIRTKMSFQQAGQALQSLEASDFAPCSNAHIGWMRTLTLNTKPIEEIGYFENGYLKCTSWGMTEGRIKRVAPDFTAPDGMDITLRINPAVTGSKPMLAMHYQRHNVLVDPTRFVDIVAEPNIQLAISTGDNNLLATLNVADAAALKAMLAKPNAFMDDDYLVAKTRNGAWTAIALEPRSDLYTSLRRELMLLLPVGALMACAIIGLVIWFSRRRLSPLGELEIAVQKREFIVHYQPIIDLGTGTCIGAEALVRWRRPDGSMVRPDLFIPLAEDSGLITAITDQVVDAVVQDLGTLLVSDRAMHVAINICAQDIKTGRFLPVVQKAIERTEIHASQIWLEATERGLIDQEASRATLERARELGFTIAIDDFGTGYSSLAYLQSMAVDILKIDKSFIDTIGTDSAKSSVTPYIIDMAKALKLKIVAEGVETTEQSDYLRERNVDCGQGWLFAKALPIDQFIMFCLANRKQRSGRGHIQLVA